MGHRYCSSHRRLHRRDGSSSRAPGSVNEEKARRGSGRKDFLGAFADLNSGFRIRTDNMGNAPAELIAHSEEGGAG